LSEHVAMLSETTDRAAREVPAAGRGRWLSINKLCAVALVAGSPVLLVLLSHVAVATTGQPGAG
jgi:hypothetical protein